MVKPVNDPNQLSRLVLRGYKSIAQCDVAMGRLNVLIGANGAGKSNFVGFFRLVHSMLNQQLQVAVGLAGGPDALLHFGRKQTEELFVEMYFGDNSYRFTLKPTLDNRMVFATEVLGTHPVGFQGVAVQLGSGHVESWAENYRTDTGWGERITSAIRGWRIYHVHDTGNSALVKQIHNIRDNEYLREDARNLAAFLLRLKNHFPKHYQRIVKVIRLVAPFFGEFHLRPTLDNNEKIQLEWTEQGQDEPFAASALSDGTLRFMCLATVLLQPAELMPKTVLIDEPELGLHPFAISVLAGLMKSGAQDYQLIVSTQSTELVNEFDAEDLIMVDKRGGHSTFKRPEPDSLAEWLEEYSLGELWKKNLLGGRPGR